MARNDLQKQDTYTPLSTDHDHIHSRTLEEFPEGPYGSPLLQTSLGKSSGWDTGEHVNPRFSFENKRLHNDLPRLDPPADPIRYEDAKDETMDNLE
ncbi:MAG: hypothetical protein H0Z33_01415 [Bacillaceae bacterium]|nr:hypothetical protein [Bacillaceae bacterium]